MLDLAWWTWFRWQLPLKTIVGDTRYGTIDNVVAVEAQGIQAFFPLHSEAARTHSLQKMFAPNLFHYDREGDYYICPQGQSLPYYTANSTCSATSTKHLKKSALSVRYSPIARPGSRVDASVTLECPPKSRVAKKAIN